MELQASKRRMLSEVEVRHTEIKRLEENIKVRETKIIMQSNKDQCLHASSLGH